MIILLGLEFRKLRENDRWVIPKTFENKVYFAFSYILNVIKSNYAADEWLFKIRTIFGKLFSVGDF